MDLYSYLRVLKRMMQKPDLSGVKRSDLLKTYIHLCNHQKYSSASNIAKVLNFSVIFHDATTLMNLYQDIFIESTYKIFLDTPTPSIIDCGSNIGLSILYFKSLYPDAHVVGFEPHPKLYKSLVHNIHNNGLKNVHVFQKALSDQTGSLEFFVNDGNNPGSLNMGFIQRENTAKSIYVETDLLSDYIDDNKVDLIKIDIEGAEENVLRDLKNQNKFPFIQNIICEFHHHIDENVDRFSLVLKLFEEANFGYQLFVYTAFPPRLGGYQDVLIYAYNKNSS